MFMKVCLLHYTVKRDALLKLQQEYNELYEAAPNKLEFPILYLPAMFITMFTQHLSPSSPWSMPNNRNI
jgi:hypothetical protein